MQSSNVQSTAASLLSQLMGFGLGEGGALDSSGGQEFIGAMGSQIRDLLVDAGEDPAELAGIEDGALVAQFIALMQGQAPDAEATGGFGFGVGTGAAALLGTEGEPVADQGTASGSLQGARIGSLPSFVLEQLTQSAKLDGEAMDQTGETLDAVALVRQLLAARGQAGDGAKSDGGLVSTELGADASSDLEGYLRSLLTQSVGPGVSGRIVEEQLPGGSGPVRAGDGESDQSGQSTFPVDESLRDLMMEGIDESDGDDAPDTAAHPSLIRTSGGTDAQSVAQRAAVLDLTRLLQPGGEGRLAEQVRWFVQAGMETAEMRLHPPSLGALDVRITMEADQAHVRFVTSHPIVKEVLEAALPRLREALGQEGLSLGDVTVSERAPEGRDEAEQDQATRAWGRQDFDAELDDAPEEPALAAGTLSALSRRLDYFV